MIEALLDGVEDRDVETIIIGDHWTSVRTDLALGLTATQGAGLDTLRLDAGKGAFSNRSLAQVAAMALSTIPAERALGLAAINASYNHEPIDGSLDDGLSDLGTIGRTVVIGRFPKLDEKIPGAQVIELDPGPNDYPSDAAPRLIPGADNLIITSSTLGNGTLQGLLDLVDKAKVTLVGPGTPLAPVLHDFGMDRLAGFLPLDRDSIEQVVRDGGGVKAFKPFGRNVTLATAA